MKRRHDSPDPYEGLRRQAKASVKRIRALTVRRASPLAGLSAEEAIEHIRAVREELWQQKFAHRP